MRTVGRWTVQYRGQTIESTRGGGTRAVPATLRVEVVAPTAADAARIAAQMHGGRDHRTLARVS